MSAEGVRVLPVWNMEVCVRECLGYTDILWASSVQLDLASYCVMWCQTCCRFLNQWILSQLIQFTSRAIKRFINALMWGKTQDDSKWGEQPHAIYCNTRHRALALLPGSKILQNKFLLFCGDKERTQNEGGHFGRLVSEAKIWDMQERSHASVLKQLSWLI